MGGYARGGSAQLSNFLSPCVTLRCCSVGILVHGCKYPASMHFRIRALVWHILFADWTPTCAYSYVLQIFCISLPRVLRASVLLFLLQHCLTRFEHVSPTNI